MKRGDAAPVVDPLPACGARVFAGGSDAGKFRAAKKGESGAVGAGFDRLEDESVSAGTVAQSPRTSSLEPSSHAYWAVYGRVKAKCF